jgi:p-methyltransferase
MSSIDPFNMPHLGALYLTSFLRRHGLEVEVINYYNANSPRLTAALGAGAKSIALTTTFYVTDEPIRMLMNKIRTIAPDIPVIVGGPRIFAMCQALTGKPLEAYLRMLGADIYIVDSQGEKTLERVIRAISRGDGRLADIPNIIWRTGGGGREEFEATARAPEANDLESNGVDWASFDNDLYRHGVFLRTARSCPFSCAFCNYPGFAGRHVVMSVDAVIREMTALVKLGVRDFAFVDDTFNVPLPRFKDLLRAMKHAGFEISWTSFLRCSNVDEEALDLMAESGCRRVFLGIESGDERVLRNMRKFANVERYIQSIKGLTSRGIETLASIIVGFPGETEATVQNTVELLQNSDTTYYTLQLYYHDPLAPIEGEREKYNIQGSGFSWSHSTMDWREAIGMKEAILDQVDRPYLLPLYGLSIWSLSYLYANSVHPDNFKRLLRYARPHVLSSLRDAAYDAEWSRDDLCNALRDSSGSPA